MLVLNFRSGFLRPPQISLSPDDGGKHLLRKVDANILLYTASYPGISESSNSFLLLYFFSFQPSSPPHTDASKSSNFQLPGFYEKFGRNSS
jgi:hypothetical protein